jgi:hypothetical protein
MSVPDVPEVDSTTAIPAVFKTVQNGSNVSQSSFLSLLWVSFSGHCICSVPFLGSSPLARTFFIYFCTVKIDKKYTEKNGHV